MLRSLSGLMMLLSIAAHAAEAPAVPSPGGDLAGSIGQMAFGLGVVVAVLMACLWLLKRLGAPRGSARGMKVLGAAPVGPRERVVLVEVAGKVLVLGVAPGRVNTLHSVDAEQLNSAAATTEPTADTGGFATRLKAMVEAHKHA